MLEGILEIILEIAVPIVAIIAGGYCLLSLAEYLIEKILDKYDEKEKEKFEKEKRDILLKKYSNIPVNELRWILKELNWVCESLRDYSFYSGEEVWRLIISGDYNPLYPPRTAREKLQYINNKYGWRGKNEIKFSHEDSASGVYENRYFVACLISKDGTTTYPPHYPSHYIKKR